MNKDWVTDALFEVCYLPDFRSSVRTLRDEYAGSFEAFWQDSRTRPVFTKENDAFRSFHTVATLLGKPVTWIEGASPLHLRSLYAKSRARGKEHAKYDERNACDSYG